MKLKVLSIASLAIMVALVAASSAHAAVIRQGPSFTPAGSNITLFAVQGIDAANPLGQAGFSPQVNNNFEFNPSIGVTYQNGGTLTDFGLGLYSGVGGATESTGLKGVLSAPSAASSVTIQVEDFDIKSNAAFNTQKVEPLITLFGANGAVLGTATPSQILGAMVQTGANTDIWNVNLGAVAQSLGLAAGTNISGYLLAADAANGEKPNSDPYLLLAAGNGIPVIPEPSSFLPLFGVLGTVMGSARLRRKRAIVAA